MYLDNYKKKDISEEVLINTWLEQYYGVTLSDVKGDYKKDENGKFSVEETRKFYNDFALTEEQHDKWDKQLRKELRKKLKVPKGMFDRSYGFVYLNIAPTIQKD